MAIKTFRPLTPGQRFKTGIIHTELTKGVKPLKSATKGMSKSAGRNSSGRITVRHQGGGAKRRYREIDFLRNKYGIQGSVKSLEYDPNRSAHIAMIAYVDGDKRYIIAPEGLKVGHAVMSGPDSEISTGNCLALERVPLGTFVHNVELIRGKGAQLARSAGSSVQLMSKDNGKAQLRLPSGEIRQVPLSCYATIGVVSNGQHGTIKIGKAGRNRHMGVRPSVRGVAMAPNAHPHGGGEGKSGTGMPPKTPWGKPALGYRTRRKNKPSNKLIIRRRK
jgi:large subunit ribosomal protein L2